MALKFEVKYRKLEFLFEAGTSRGTLNYKNSWIIRVFDNSLPEIDGLGEAGPLSGLSVDDVPDFEEKLKHELKKIEDSELPSTTEKVFELAKNISANMPSVRFGIETALLDLLNGGKRKCFDNDFYKVGAPIQINGLIWMGDSDLMLARLEEKINQGFRCIKLKIGAIDFEREMDLLEKARNRFSNLELELRVDANGAFTFEQAQNVLERLGELKVHSIEQPIKAGQLKDIAKLCSNTPVPIALDEELIGIEPYLQKQKLLEQIKPQYIILKPSLLGGFANTLEWIEIAKSLNIGWWVTSALESNVGLNAICQFTSWLKVSLPQGLGTGSLYKNNIDSPLEVIGDQIQYNTTKEWGRVFD